MINLFKQSKPADRNYHAAIILGIAVGFCSIFIKWGTGNLFPPFSPPTSVKAPPVTIMAFWGFTGHMYTWVGKGIGWGTLLHGTMAFCIMIPYALLAERFPRITIWRGVGFGIFADIFLHTLLVPLMGTMPGLFGPDLWMAAPWHLALGNNFGELFSHVLTYWICEEMRRSMRMTVTGKMPVANFKD